VNRTKIEWCDFTWNPVIGCTGGCPYCYARRMAHRFHLGSPDFRPAWVEENFQRQFPKKPSRIFVNSMSDVSEWKAGWVGAAFYRMWDHPEHLFLFLTKHPDGCLPRVYSTQNVWLGMTVTRSSEMAVVRDAIKDGRVSFLSIEPILEDVQIGQLGEAFGLQWVIVGAETGNRKGKVVPALSWLFDIKKWANDRGIRLFFKDSLRDQWGEDDFPREVPLAEPAHAALPPAVREEGE
jgi:protein gp37